MQLVDLMWHVCGETSVTLERSVENDSERKQKWFLDESIISEMIQRFTNSCGMMKR